MTKKQLLEKLNSSEDLLKIAYVPVSEVINWVNELEESNIDLTDLVDDIAQEITRGGINFIDHYELTLNCNELELVDVSFDRYEVEKTIQKVIDSYRSE
jgi:hypothetical protein